MADMASIGARLRHLRHELDTYGVHGKNQSGTWDELVDLYDEVLEDAANAAGIELPGRPRSSGRRFTQDVIGQGPDPPRKR
jgi:hypothetical protein